jgi:hypothetical protein
MYKNPLIIIKNPIDDVKKKMVFKENISIIFPCKYELIRYPKVLIKKNILT